MDLTLTRNNRDSKGKALRWLIKTGQLWDALGNHCPNRLANKSVSKPDKRGPISPGLLTCLRILPVLCIIRGLLRQSERHC